MKNQLRKCDCGKVWKTHEKGEKLFRCPRCGSTRKHHQILTKKDGIFIHHLITTDDYDNLLLNRTWHDFFGKRTDYLYLKNQ
jgi:DNA-directed RNA polymerase subunit RPC12/RpoP